MRIQIVFEVCLQKNQVFHALNMSTSKWHTLLYLAVSIRPKRILKYLAAKHFGTINNNINILCRKAFKYLETDMFQVLKKGMYQGSHRHGMTRKSAVLEENLVLRQLTANFFFLVGCRSLAINLRFWQPESWSQTYEVRQQTYIQMTSQYGWITAVRSSDTRFLCHSKKILNWL